MVKTAGGACGGVAVVGVGVQVARLGCAQQGGLGRSMRIWPAGERCGEVSGRCMAWLVWLERIRSMTCSSECALEEALPNWKERLIGAVEGRIVGRVGCSRNA